MLYTFIWGLMRLAIPVYFRRMVVRGKQHFPKGKPVILASNHPNTFLDPLVVGLYYPKQLHFLVRADVFTNRWVSALLRALHQLPIYRMRDGYNQLQRNRDTFHECLQLLTRQKPLLFFSEADSVNETRLRPLKKGTVRLAFEAATGQFPEMVLVPVGITYSNFNRFRGEVAVSFGAPIPVKEYLKTYEESPAVAYRQLNERLTEAIRREMVDIPREENEELILKCCQWARESLAPPLNPLPSYNDNWLVYQQNVVRWFATHSSDSLSRELMVDQIEEFETLLHNHKLKFFSIRKEIWKNGTFTLIVVFGAVFGIPGLLFNWIPQFIAHMLVKKVAGNTIFEGAVNLSLRTLIHLFWLIAVGFGLGIGWALLAMLLGWFGLLWQDCLHFYVGRDNWESLKRTDPELAEKIVAFKIRLTNELFAPQ